MDFLFWTNVKLLLKERNLSITKLASLTGLNRQTIANQMSANSVPNVVSAFKIATVLGVSVEYLITGKPLVINRTDVISYINKHLF